MRTHGHREESTLGSVGGGQGRDSGRVGRSGIIWGENSDVGDGGMEANKPHCHVCTYATILPDMHMYPRTLSTIKK